MAMVKNPTKCQFVNSDTDATGFEADFKKVADGVIVQTLTVSVDQTTIIDGKTTFQVNVMPIAKGVYVTILRTLVGPMKSADSMPSPTWERAAGPPTDVTML
jgi:hypothetical protein